MANDSFINIVGTRCKPEIEDKFNNWYTGTHIPLLMKFPGLQKVKRYKISEASADYPAYLAVYYFASRQAYEAYQQSPELKAAIDEMKSSWPGGEFEITWRVQYNEIASMEN